MTLNQFLNKNCPWFACINLNKMILLREGNQLKPSPRRSTSFKSRIESEERSGKSEWNEERRVTTHAQTSWELVRKGSFTLVSWNEKCRVKTRKLGVSFP